MTQLGHRPTRLGGLFVGRMSSWPRRKPNERPHEKAPVLDAPGRVRLWRLSSGPCRSTVTQAVRRIRGGPGRWVGTGLGSETRDVRRSLTPSQGTEVRHPWRTVIPRIRMPARTEHAPCSHPPPIRGVGFEDLSWRIASEPVRGQTRHPHRDVRGWGIHRTSLCTVVRGGSIDSTLMLTMSARCASGPRAPAGLASRCPLGGVAGLPAQPSKPGGRTLPSDPERLGSSHSRRA